MREKKIQNKKDLAALRDKIKRKNMSYEIQISVSNGTCGQARGSGKIVHALRKEIERQKIQDKVKIRATGCHGFCEIEPNIIVFPEGIFYQKLKLKDVKEIISQTVINNKIIDDLLYIDSKTNKRIAHEREIPFYLKQQRIVSGNNVYVDPTDINDYLAQGGYEALSKVLSENAPEEIIEIIKSSGLRGRGGAGFLTGAKWKLCRNAANDGFKFVICNADEGDPGAYMDRSLLEGNPHSVLEGMIIGAYAIGANQGYVYVRDEYPLAVKHVTIAIEQAREYGLLGKNIMGSDFDFDIIISKGEGAFVCGEETALIASIEGKRGEPRQRPPYPVQKGLWGRPTNINNIETWATVPLIINKGAEWFSKIGTKGSKGTKIFSLVGKINNTGLVEVPMGITLREIIYDIGGGIPGKKEFKAVQTGGPSGGCLPKELLDLPIDYESLVEAGSIMGSGGMIVMDEATCMVDVAKYFLNFLRDESCGKCLSCREGTQRMWEIVNDISEGKGKEGDIELLEELAQAVKLASMCGLGQTASNPVLSTLRYFREEYEAHIRDKKCPAGVCKALIQYSIDEKKCTGCMACIKPCPQGAIKGELKKIHTLDQSKCIKCGACYETCKFGAIVIK
jgi:NADH-quinone oxidoreductase subunit F